MDLLLSLFILNGMRYIILVLEIIVIGLGGLYMQSWDMYTSDVLIGVQLVYLVPKLVCLVLLQMHLLLALAIILVLVL